MQASISALDFIVEDFKCIAVLFLKRFSHKVDQHLFSSAEIMLKIIWSLSLWMSENLLDTCADFQFTGLMQPSIFYLFDEFTAESAVNSTALNTVKHVSMYSREENKWRAWISCPYLWSFIVRKIHFHHIQWWSKLSLSILTEMVNVFFLVQSSCLLFDP